MARGYAASNGSCNDKLMVVLEDDDVRLMVKNKLAGYNPVEVVRQNIEDFRLGV